MQAYFFVAPPSIDRSACSNQNISVGPWVRWSKQRGALRCRSKVSASAISGNQQNHYSVLGVPNNASSSDIKKAYRLLALKYHPDVSKDSGADEVFKKIRLAYEVLSDESTRNQYDNALRRQDYNTGPLGGDWEYNFEYYNGGRTYKWADSKRSRRRQRYWEEYHTRENFYENDDELEKEIPDEEERGPFAEVLRSSFISLFLMYTVGMRWSLTFSSLMAFFDRKLDAGYKTGYLLAWILGGTGGILLTLCLSFTSWLFGKTSSSVVSLVVIATWIGCNAPIPQGAILTLLYMSIKLQGDLG